MARPLPFLLLNIALMIREITILGRHISTNYLDGKRETGVEVVNGVGGGSEREDEDTQKILILRKGCITMRQKLAASASRCHATAHECKRRLSALLLLV
jgi:hypothetical protein